MSAALAGVRVLEIADGTAGSFCAKILADLGAEVLKVEPSGGHRSRLAAPRRADAGAGEAGGRFLYLNTSKSSVVIGGEEGEDRLRDLVGSTDVLITDLDTPELSRLGTVPPRVVWMSIRPYGSTGPYADFRAHHLTVFHAGGEGSILPSGPGWKLFPERPPIQLGGDIAEFDAGWNAAVAILAACYDQLRSGRGQRIDVSVQESQLTLNRTRLSRFNNDGVVLHREGSRYGITGMMRCADGWVQLVGLRDEHWDRLLKSADAGELDDPMFATAQGRETNIDALGVALASWCSARAKADVVKILAARAPRLSSGGRDRRRCHHQVAGSSVSPVGHSGRGSVIPATGLVRGLLEQWVSLGSAGIPGRGNRGQRSVGGCAHPRFHVGGRRALCDFAPRASRSRGREGGDLA
jgi:crotonobetainyl-CoA:carnitine CoA-transferase CaiB-like acyl-CoA transferase